jgi:hypothetical protein
MKKYVVFFLFLLAGFSLYSQSFREVRVYVPPIDGIGVIDDMAYFYKQISAEIILQNRVLGRTRSTSDYVVTGRIEPISEATDGVAHGASDENILYVELYNNITNEVVGTQFLTYSGWPDDTTDESLSVIIYNMLAGIPELIESHLGGDEWRNKLIYLNLCFLWVPRVYIGTHQSVNVANVGGEVLVDYHFMRFMALKAGAQITQEWVVPYQTSSETHMDMIIQFPVSVAFVARPGELLMVEPYLGGSLNLSLLGTTIPSVASWHGGITIGIKAGIGIVTFDPRFSMDILESQSTSGNYRRYTIQVGLGYKMGFINKRRR